MKALVYRGPGKQQLEEMPKPVLRESTDALVRMTKTTICGRACDTFGNAGREHALKFILTNERGTCG